MTFLSYIVKEVQAQLRDAVLDAVKKAAENGEIQTVPEKDFIVEKPADSANGDFSTNAAMAWARELRMAPVKIADVIIRNIDLGSTYFEKCECAGPGFLNFYLSAGYYAAILKDVKSKGEKYGHSDYGTGKKALVEFVSANPTGPMHVGNARGGAMGDCLAEVLSWAGYETEREFYINDGGNQIEKFGLSLDIRYRQLYEDGIEMPEDSYHGQDIIDHAKAFAQIHGDKYISLPEQERRKALVDYALPLNIAGLERDLLKYKIKYDTWFKESTLHSSGAARQVVADLTERGFTYEQDGAVWFKAEQFGCDKDFVLVRSNGLLTYIVPDIAYHYNKLCIRNFDLAVDILGADHHGYVPRLKAALQALGVDPDKLKVVLMQMVRLVKDGEVIKASKRSGKAITLVTLLEEVPIDAARFFFNMREANSHCDFDLDLAVEQSSKNPVYYCQYAHARICSIFKKLSSEGIELKADADKHLEMLTEEPEKDIIRHIASLTGEIETAAAQLDPSRLTKYTVELATLFHKFYNACRVNCDDENLTQARLYLCSCVRDVLKNVLALLKISAPESM